MEDPVLLSYVLFIAFCIVSGALIQWGVSKMKYSPPVSILWMMFGALLSLAELGLDRSTPGETALSKGNKLFALGVVECSKLPHNVIYFILLPILLYDATQQVDWFYFQKNLRNGCALAVTGIILQIGLIGGMMKFMASGLGLSLEAWLVVSAGVGATDPIAVLSVLEHMDAPKQLSSLFDCESLINDGTAVFIFQFFKVLARGGSITVQEAVLEFLRLTLLAPIVGLLSAVVLYRIVRHFKFHGYDVTLLILGVSYLVFTVSEVYINTSGPVAMVVFGLYFKAYGRAGLDHQANQIHHTIIKGLGVCATSLVFIITGITCVRIFWNSFTDSKLADPDVTVPDFSRSIWWYLPLFYVVCHIARGAMVVVFIPLFRHDLGSFIWQEAVLLWWGGLRGGVCLIVALLLEQDLTVPLKIRNLAALYLAGTTFMILLINGTTFQLMFKALQPYELNPFKALYLTKVLRFLDAEFEREAKLLSDHWLFRGTAVLELSKRLVPRLGNLSVSTSHGIQFGYVDVRNALTDVHDCRIWGNCDSDSGAPSDLMIQQTSSPVAYCEDLENPPELGRTSSSNVSITNRSAGRRFPHKVPQYSPSKVLFNTDDLGDPFLPASDPIIAPSAWQPLYRVAAYSGGYTFRNRVNPQTPTQDNEPLETESVGSSQSSKTSESSWTTHFLDPTHRLQTRDHNVLSPHAAKQIKTVMNWQRESEVCVMVMNASRILYRRMYEQNFISGNNYMHFMAISDTINDFAVSRGKPWKLKRWHKLIADQCKLEKKLAICSTDFARKDLLDITPFDLEWMLNCRQLHVCSNWELPVYKSIQKERLRFNCLRKMLMTWWRFVGSRQTFPALSDLQEVCAYVDVHDEMLMRGNPGLKFVLGQHLLDSYIGRAQLSQTFVIQTLREEYPKSFKFALICHGAIFLINLKIQLVEEYYERGLLMASDAELILTTLKGQLVRIMKFHPDL